MFQISNIATNLGFGEISTVISSCMYCLNRFGGVYAASVGVIIFTCLGVRYYKKTFGLWKKLGVPGPSPWIPFGNFHQMMLKGAHNMDMDNHMKYGSTWGTFTLTSPEINITDANQLKSVLVKDFDHFVNRRFIFPGLRQFFAPQQMKALRGKQSDGTENSGDATLFDQALGVLHDEQWRNVRDTLSPSFSPAKLKQMLPYIKYGIDTLIEIVTEQTEQNQPVDLRQQFENLTLDVIASASLGVKIQSQRNSDDQIVRCMDEMVAQRPTLLSLLSALLFPSTVNKVLDFTGGSIKQLEAESKLRKIFARMINSRRSSAPKIPADFLQLMLNSQSAKQKDLDETTSENSDLKFEKTDSNAHWSKKALSNSEIMSQMYVFMGASYDSTPPTLAMTAYYLAFNQQMQQRVFEEVQDAFSGEEELTYEVVQSGLPLLEACLLETLRLWPPFTKFARTTKQDYNLDGVLIPKGCGVVVPAYVIHRMPQYYHQPDQWKPERMLPDERKNRDPFTFLPFGQGPRNCIGMKFAVLELKMVMAHFEKEFKLDVNRWTPMQVNMEDRFGLLKPTHPIFLGITKRNGN